MPRLAEPLRHTVPTEQVSNGCFETMRAYRGRIFRLESHLDRLYASAAFLGTQAPSNRRGLAARLNGALARSGIREAVVRIALMVRPGREAMPSIVVQPAIQPSAAQYRSGIRVAVVPARKFSVASINPESKYSARLGSVLAVMDAQLRGVDEALFMDAMGSVTESTASNFGIVSRGVIKTPPVWLGLLAGITRDVLFELADGLHIRIGETPLTQHDLYNADEAFMTSTLKEVLGVSWIDGRKIGSGRPGPVTRKLLAGFGKLVKDELHVA